MTLGHAERGAWLIAGIGIVGSVIGWIAAPALFPHAWLAALTCWLGWPLGSLALLFIHALTGGRWGFAIRGQLATAVATLPLVLPAMLPYLFAVRSLYPWMRPEVAAHLANRFYLNAPFFYARGALYLIVWLGLGALALKALRQENPEPLLYRLAPVGLILLALTVTFFAIDTTLSLEPHFKSSIYGMLAGCEAVLLALAVAVMGMAFATRDATETVRDLGRLLFALLLLWAYFDFMQILIVWNSDLPPEADWYLRRLVGGWAIVAGLIAMFHFLLPLFTLIWPQVQRSPPMLGSVAGLLVLIEVPRVWWSVIPAAGRQLTAIDVAAMMAMLGVAAGMALRVFRRARFSAGVASHA